MIDTVPQCTMFAIDGFCFVINNIIMCIKIDFEREKKLCTCSAVINSCHYTKKIEKEYKNTVVCVLLHTCINEYDKINGAVIGWIM